MIELEIVVRGLVIGLSLAAPVGPIGLLVIRRTLAGGRLAGFVTGLGAAAADGLYGAIAGLGLSAVSGFLTGGQTVMRVGGGLFLCYLGLRGVLAKRTSESGTETRAASLFGAFLSTLALTLANPMTILSFAAIFAGLGVGIAGSGPVSVVLFVSAVFAGSAVWWLALSGGVSIVRSRVTPKTLRWIDVGSGAVVFGFGMLALAGV